MDYQYFVTIKYLNENFTPWNGKKQYDTNEIGFDTWAMASEYAKERRANWEEFAEIWDFQTGEYETASGYAWAIVNKGTIIFSIEIWPKPDPEYDDLPW